uniref:Uncharacterized protein n=1 Tax=Cucumis melo TaxID=3656 RepID=A0A9I9E6P7_CUCME
MKGKKEKRRVSNLLHDFFFCTKHLSPNPSTLFSLIQGRTGTSFRSSSLSLFLSCPFPASSSSSYLRFINISNLFFSPSPNFPHFVSSKHIISICRLQSSCASPRFLIRLFYSNFGLLVLGCTFDIYELLDFECLRKKVWRKPLENWRHIDKSFQAWKAVNQNYHFVHIAPEVLLKKEYDDKEIKGKGDFMAIFARIHWSNRAIFVAID